MKAQTNAFKRRLLAGDRLIGLWSSLCSVVAVEALAGAGYDWLLFDTEHSPVEVAGVLPLLQAAASGESDCVVRPASNDRVLIKRILDIGAQTILVPFVESVADATDAVHATRYPPLGARGVAGSTRASRFGRARDYFTIADREVCVLVQIETRQALGEMRAIAAVEGVDGIFIGPSDLAASMGHLGKPAHPEVQAALKSAAELLVGIGKPAGILATNETDARRYFDWGFQFVAASVDLGILVKGADTLLTSLKLQIADE